ncbi:hypothetical protein V9T40_010298 [Parthenolecanium corni]|uniref:Large ribosomal subunit protein mL43 n=1 Tax=Parthenolecanium corni TaxID=536013 RepID=A0AAN9XZW0_9HEMI
MSNRSRLVPIDFPRVPLKNGVSRVICQLKRITIKFCKSSGASYGVRSFIEHDLLDYSRKNPEVAIYLKPRRHHSPVVVSEYLNGEKHYMNYHNFTRDNVDKWMNFHRTSVGWPKKKWRKLHYTRTPSVQGVWSPFTNMDPRLNITKFPDKYLGIPLHSPETATEKLREMFEKQKLNEENEEKVGKVKIEVQS